MEAVVGAVVGGLFVLLGFLLGARLTGQSFKSGAEATAMAASAGSQVVMDAVGPPREGPSAKEFLDTLLEGSDDDDVYVADVDSYEWTAHLVPDGDDSRVRMMEPGDSIPGVDAGPDLIPDFLYAPDQWEEPDV